MDFLRFTGRQEKPTNGLRQKITKTGNINNDSLSKTAAPGVAGLKVVICGIDFYKPQHT